MENIDSGMYASHLLTHDIVRKKYQHHKYDYNKDFQNTVLSVVNPYGEGNATDKIMDILKNETLPKELKKAFYDL